jgi:mono/diheme cytochrome c family protein
VRFQNINYARNKAIIALVFVFVALIISPGIVQSRAQGLAQQGTFSRAAFANRLNHGMFAIPAAYVTKVQDAGQAATPPDASSTTTPPPSAPPQPKKVELPEGEGKSLALDYCQDCHRLTNLSRSHKSPADWKETVDTMVDRGARLPPENVDALVQYLSKNFGPKTDAPATGVAAPAPSAAASPAPAAPVAPDAAQTAPASAKKVELPEGDGKAIATANCQACHRLTNLTKAHKSLDEWRDTVKTMMDRGADVPADQMETLVQYLAKNFGPKAADAGAVAPAEGATPASSSPSQ